jgi:hypothetical protein
MAPSLMKKADDGALMRSALGLPENFRGPRGPLQHRCQLEACHEPSPSMLRCSGCKVVRYCSKEHQTQDWHLHKSICSKIKKRRTKLEKEENAVRNATPDFVSD